MDKGYKAKINKCKDLFALCCKMRYIVSMDKNNKIKNEININVRVDTGLMQRINKCCVKKWNISISVFARQALKNFCEIIEKE